MVRTAAALSCVMFAAAAATVAVVVMSAGAAHADATSSADLAAIEKALPAGWTMIETDAELLFRHDRPCYRGTEQVPGDPVPAKAGAAKAGKGDGALVTLELRYRLEAKWTPAQFAEATAANAAADAAVKAARERHRIDAIKVVKGTYAPATADEKARVEAFTRDEAAANGKRVREPLCTLGDTAIFDGDETYAPLKLQIDPPEAGKEAWTIVALVKKRCGAK